MGRGLRHLPGASGHDAKYNHYVRSANSVLPGDDARSDDFAQDIEEITDALGDSTRRTIYLLACESPGGTTAADAAKATGLHPNVARHHLEKLARTGYLEVASARERQACAGRPSKRYVKSAKDVPLVFPSRQDRLLVGLLLRSLAGLDPAQASAMAEAAGEEYGARLAEGARAEGRPPRRHEALTAGARALTDHGFAATADSDDTGIVAHDCPFKTIAAQYPQIVCALDRGMVRGMLERLAGIHSEPRTAASLPQGDDFCVISQGGSELRPTPGPGPVP